MPYTGRFAPSPTGQLHAGSMVAALASYLDARANGGRWMIRFDDIDPPRQVTGSEQAIIHCLRAHGMRPDDNVHYQSERSAVYDAALKALKEGGHTFRCRCTRRELATNGSCIRSCREEQIGDDEITSIRIHVPKNTITTFTDRLRGEQQLSMGSELDNFIVRRRDGLYAYQLACAVDDDGQKISDVIRGADLLASTHRQIWIQRCLGIRHPRYGHIPILHDTDGNKLSKQTGAPVLSTDAADVSSNLISALGFLGQKLPENQLDVFDLLAHATQHWSPERIVT